jgi:hypothetical protein
VIVPFDSAVSNELLVTTGRVALDWLLGGSAKVALDWLVGTPNELTLLRLIARVDNGVTVNIVESELDPSSVASTVCCPTVEVGAVKLVIQ